MEEENEKTLAETINSLLFIVRRHKFFLLIPFIVISIVSSLVAMKLPLTFLSKGTILIEEQQVPQSMIQSTITGFADERIRFIEQRVMTRERILSIIDKYHLYAKDQKKKAPSELVKRFQEHATVEMIAADVRNPSGGGVGKATIAFTISFNATQAATAQEVTNELVNLFLAENSRVRTQRATKTTEFLSEEAERVNRDIQNIENKIAEFKEKFGRSLPELLPANLSAAERVATELLQTENQVNLLKERITYLTTSLPQARKETPVPQQIGEKATAGLSKEEQIRTLKAEYMHLTSQYNPAHPDVVRVERQLKALDPGFEGVPDKQDVALELEKARHDLDSFEDKYGENHPDVVKLKQKIKKLEQQQTAPKPAADAKPTTATGSTGSSDPVYISLVGQLNSSQTELEGLVKRQAELRKNLEQINSYIAQTPQVERGYNELVRGRASSMEKYTELKDKAQEAKLSQALEEGQKGESFTLIEPPLLPDKPEKGTRAKFVFMGIGAGLVVGLGGVFLAEALDSSVRGFRALQAITGIPPIMVVPYVINDDDLEHDRKRMKLLKIILLVMLAISAVLVHFLVMPWDAIWEKLVLSVQRT